jgi:hypothetical protein
MIKVVAVGGSQGDVFTYWLPVKMQDTISLAKVSLKLGSIKIKDPVLVDLLDGSVYDIQATIDANGKLVFTDLPLSDYAFAIVSRKAIKIQPVVH